MKINKQTSSTWTSTKAVPRKIGRAAKLVLRKVKLQIVPQLTAWRGTIEEPKVAIYRNRGIVLLHLLPHVIPLTGVIALLVLNINTLFVGNLSTAAVAAFQFAAKLLELLAQASLAGIIIDLVRRQIVFNQDLPLGSLVAALRTTDVSYLWSLELWGSLTSKQWRLTRRLCFGLLIILTIVLAALIGPSGAVAIVPRQITHANGQYLNILNAPSNLFPMSPDYL